MRYRLSMGRPRTYSDDDLRRAVATCRSWRGVLQSLGLRATSSSAIRSARRHADQLGLDHSHFTGQRRWTDQALIEAVGVSRSWPEVATHLGLANGGAESALKGHALRLGIDTAHFQSRANATHRSEFAELAPEPQNLRRAGPTMAAAWFLMCGCDVSWPLEPCRYDLLAVTSDTVSRIQVKTTSVRSGDTWTVWISTTSGRRTVYDPGELDYFFIITAELDCFLIPVARVGGFLAIHLSAYEDCKVWSGG